MWRVKGEYGGWIRTSNIFFSKILSQDLEIGSQDLEIGCQTLKIIISGSRDRKSGSRDPEIIISRSWENYLEIPRWLSRDPDILSRDPAMIISRSWLPISRSWDTIFEKKMLDVLILVSNFEKNNVGCRNSATVGEHIKSSAVFLLASFLFQIPKLRFVIKCQ